MEFPALRGRSKLLPARHSTIASSRKIIIVLVLVFGIAIGLGITYARIVLPGVLAAILGGNLRYPSAFDLVERRMPTKRTWSDFWTDVLLVGGVVIVLSVSSTSAFFHWLDTQKNTAVERIIHH